FDNIDAMAVIFGSPGLFPVYDVYDLLDEKMKVCKKPIYPILPSVVNVKDEIEKFIDKGRINFPDEVNFGKALTKVFHTCKPAKLETTNLNINKKAIREVIDNAPNGYLNPEQTNILLDAAGISRAHQKVVYSAEEAIEFVKDQGYPQVMKVVGPVHKSDVGGVALNIKDKESVIETFNRLMKIKDTYAVLMNKMLFGTEVFIGAKREDKFGHMVLTGLGGIFIEILKDVNTSITPVSFDEANWMIKNLKSYGIIKGARGQEPVNEKLLAEQIVRVSALVEAAPEIFEMDLNPLFGNMEYVTAVDARIRIEKD
ncbi:MAG TPA: acetate--CoA ligase family protein, partial [Bacteroidales bacterium]|nr:acetate--CoA ligase family protein [Bacteroidales bacterium]